jgi:hypothetical protein
LIRFENRIEHTVLPVPPVSTTPTASPHCLTPHPAADDRALAASQPTCQPRRFASPRPRRPSLSRAQRRRPRAPQPGCCRLTPCCGAVPATPRPPISPSLSPSLPPTPLGPPPRRSPLKQSKNAWSHRSQHQLRALTTSKTKASPGASNHNL